MTGPDDVAFPLVVDNSLLDNEACVPVLKRTDASHPRG
jgi:hypothetical protein